MDNRTLKRFLRLTREKRALDKKLETVKKTIKEVESRLKEQFSKAGMDGVKVDGSTVYLHRQIWARAASTREEVIDALKKTGMTEYVSETFNTNSLSAFVREAEKLDREIPPELRAVIDVTEVFSVRVRSA